MAYTQAKKTLDDLYVALSHELNAAQKSMKKNRFSSAHDRLDVALRTAEEQYTKAQGELKLEDSAVDSEIVSERDYRSRETQVLNLIEAIRTANNQCIQKENQPLLAKEAHETKARNRKIIEASTIAARYEASYQQLLALTKQPEPKPGVNEQLHVFLYEIRKSRRNGSVSPADLTQIMDTTYDYLTNQTSQEAFDKYTTKLQKKHSIPLKTLGIVLAALGALLAGSAIFFAPAIITASTGLGTIYAATAAVSVASSALSFAGGACFFKTTKQMELAKKAHNFFVDENAHYEDEAQENDSSYARGASFN